MIIGAVTAESFYRYFQLLLKELEVDFQVAPYSALAQVSIPFYG